MNDTPGIQDEKKKQRGNQGKQDFFGVNQLNPFI